LLDGEIETLRQISQNNMYSAWFDCDFGGCELGVFSAAMPVKALHAVEGGICKDATAILFDGDLKDANCRRLGLQVKLLCAMDEQHYMTSGSNKAMPRILALQGRSNKLGKTAIRARHWNSADRRYWNPDQRWQSAATESLCAGQ
jgi:hypothetical protein